MMQSEMTAIHCILTIDEAFKSHIALHQYIGVNYMSNICAILIINAPGHMMIEEVCVKSLRSAIGYIIETRIIDLDFAKLDIGSLRVVMFLDVSFAEATGMETQLEFKLLMMDRF